MEVKVLNAEKRELTGKNENNRLRSKGYIPAVVYSHGTSMPLQIKENEFFKLFKGKISESVIFDLKIKDSSDEQMAYIKDFKKNPVNDQIIHLDLYRVTKDEKIKTSVPIELEGIAKGIKMGGILKVGSRHINIECLPHNLPQVIKIDVTELDVNDSIHAREIILPEGVELIANNDALIVRIDMTRAAAEAAVTAEPAAE